LTGTIGLPIAAEAATASNSAKSLRSIIATGWRSRTPSARSPEAARAMRSLISP
jgi:hypothetical protein